MSDTKTTDFAVVPVVQMRSDERKKHFRAYMKRIWLLIGCVAVVALILVIMARSRHAEPGFGSAVTMLILMAAGALLIWPVHLLSNHAHRYRKQPKHRKRSRLYRRYRLLMLRMSRARQ